MDSKAYLPDTIVRILNTGEFARIKKECWCGGWDTPLHYEAFIEGKDGQDKLVVLMHNEIEFECPPKSLQMDCK